MKTFEVYSLYDTQYRGRTLVASVQADRFNVDGFTVTFFKDTFFSTTPISVVVAGGPIAVLDTEFSLSIEPAPVPLNPLAQGYMEASEYCNAGPEPKKRRRKKDSLLDLS